MQLTETQSTDVRAVNGPELTTNLFYGSGEGEHALRVTQGRWPTDLQGHAFIIGPDKSEPRDHWFAGDGLVLRLALAPSHDGTLAVTMRVLASASRTLRGLVPGLFRRIGGMLEVSPFGFTNYANTNLQSIEGRLFVGYDVGRPLEIDPATLDVIGAIGEVDDWVPSLPGLLDPLLAIAAHPGADHDERALYFVNYTQGPSAACETYLSRYQLDGSLRRWQLEKLGHYDTIHDVKVTRRYVVFADLPFVQQLKKGEPRRAAEQSTKLFIVKKTDLECRDEHSRVPVSKAHIDLPTGHLLAVHADGPGDEVIVYLQHASTTDLPLAIHADDRRVLEPDRGYDAGHHGLACFGAQPAIVGRYRIDASSGQVLEQARAFDLDGVWGAALATSNDALPSSRAQPKNLFWVGAGYDPRFVSQRFYELYRGLPGLLVPLDPLPKRARAPALQRVDLLEMKVADVHHFAAGELPTPPTFVPRSDAKHDLDGYVLVLVHADSGKRFELFDATDLQKGPVATLAAQGFNPPLLLHSCHMPKLERAAQTVRRPSWSRELKSRLKAQRTWWRKVVAPIMRSSSKRT